MTEAATLWQQAFEGEALGAGLFGALAERCTDDDQRATARLLERLEASTRELIRPVLERRGISVQGEAAATEQGASFAEAAASRPWPELVASFEASTASYAALYEQLAELTEGEEREIAVALVAHERALCEFARRELAGDATAAEPILALPHVAAWA